MSIDLELAMDRLRLRTPTVVSAGCLAALVVAGFALAGDAPSPEIAPEALARIRAAAVRVPEAFDEPEAAARYWAAQRFLAGRAIDVEAAYTKARTRMAAMAVSSLADGVWLTPGEAKRHRAAAGQLGKWQALGPGNIGGRTRALSIDPKRPALMLAAGVSGGIWRTTDGGGSWKPVGDLLPNIAVSVLARDPSNRHVIYAGTGEGHFREVVRSTSLPLRGGGIFVSYDDGKSWSLLKGTRGGDFLWVNDVVVSPTDPRRLYAATRTGVWRSKNGGKRWQKTLDTAVTGGCFDLAVRAAARRDLLFVSCGTFEQATVYRNLDGSGDGWQPVLSEEGMGRTSLALAPSAPNVIYALSASYVPGPNGRFRGGLHAVFRSNDDGSTWTATVRNTSPDKLSTLLLTNAVNANLVACGFDQNDFYSTLGWYTNTIAVDPTNPEVVFAGGVDLFRSDDGGASWGPITYWWASPPSAHADQHALVFHPRYDGGGNQTLFVGGDGGVWVSGNARARKGTGAFATCDPSESDVAWTSLNHGYGVTQFYHGQPFGDGRRFVGGAQDNGTLLGFSALHDSWIEIFGGDGGYVAIDPRNENVIYVEAQGLTLHKSTDGGIRFAPATAGITDRPAGGDDVGDLLFIAPYLLDPTNPDRLYFGARHLWRSTNGAGTWSAASTRWPSQGRTSAIAVSPVDPNRVVVGLDDGTIHYSASALAAGETTPWPSTLPRPGFVSSLAFDPVDPLRVYATYATFGGAHVWSSADGGASWTPIDGAGRSGLPDLPAHAIAVDPANPARLFLGTDLGVFVSTAAAVSTGGRAWAVENSGFANAVTETLVVQSVPEGGRFLVAFTHGRGAWRVPIAG